MEKEIKITDIKEKSKKSRQATEKDYIIAMIILVGIVLAFFVYANFVPKDFLQKTFERKINIEVISIESDCKNCFDLKSITQSLEKNNTKVEKKSLDYKSEEAKKIIEKYGITKVPALVAVSRNIDKVGLDKSIFSIGKDYALFDKSIPYIDIKTEQINGEVTIKEIYMECEKCASLLQIQSQMDTMGIKFKSYDKIPTNSEEGKILIKENNISFFPSLLVSKDIEGYWWVFSQIKGAFTEYENYYLFKTPILPYQDKNGLTKGLVDITYIQNKSCTDCFNVTDLKSAFQGIGVYINKENFVDVSSTEGASLINKYKINAIPTVILSKEINDYLTINKTLEQVGTFEADGKFVLRNLDSLKVKYQKINE